jgi:uncharacterized membrane protein
METVPSTDVPAQDSFLDRKVAFRLSLADVLVVVASAVYAVVFSYITITKYYTFNATAGDLGLENQIYWLTLHGSYFSSNFTQIYPFPLESLSTFILLPVYAIYPSPLTLLAAQSAFLGFAAIPLYAITKRLGVRSSLAVILAVVYLCYFPMQGGNMFDFHPESMFPLFLLLALWCWLRNRLYAFTLFLIAASLVDIVALAIGILVVVWVAVQDRNRAESAQGTALSWKGWLSWAAGRYGILLLGLVVYLVFLLKLEPQTYHGFSQAIQITSGGIANNLYLKFTLLFFVFVPVAFLPVFVDPDSFLLVAAPYLGFVFFVNDDAVQQPFYHQYMFLPTPIVFFATARVFGRLFVIASNRARNSESPSVSRTSGVLRRLGQRGNKQVAMLIVATFVFTSVYSPLGPANHLIQGYVYQGNYGLSTDLTFTQHDQYLWHIIGLVPSSASVLTQNSLPQLSGRTYYGSAYANSYLRNYTYDYVLADSNLQTTISPWSRYSSIFPIIEGYLQNRTYGIVAYADGILLLEHEYTGGAEYFVQPPPTQFPASQLLFISGSRAANGTELVHNVSLGNSTYFFYGPYATLSLPGTYEASFNLSVTNASPSNIRMVTIQVTSYSKVLAQESLSTGDFTTGGWTTFNLNFTTNTPTPGLQFRGVNVTGAANLLLSSVSLSYTSPL